MKHVVARLGLAILLAWQIFCVTESLRSKETGSARYPTLSWPATWHMFTARATRQARFTFEGRYGERWLRLPMEEWHPAAWESGYRWVRASGSATRLGPFLKAACESSGAERTRFVRETWRRRPETATQPAVKVDREVEAEIRCP